MKTMKQSIEEKITELKNSEKSDKDCKTELISFLKENDYDLPQAALDTIDFEEGTDVATIFPTTEYF